MSSNVVDETLRSVNPAAFADPLLGQLVDGYKVESLIGRGAMGMVYRGVHQVIGKAVAIKVLKSDFADDPEMVQRLVREARAVNAIRHPAIVDIFGFGTIPRTEQPYIMMDLLEGKPLDEYLREHAPMRPADVAPLLDELLGALVAAHAVGVIHRDLKPGNVFVETKHDGRHAIKVIDFGLAKVSDRAGGSVRPTNPGTLLGTPAFMAPEQVLGKRVTPATDLYAVGGIAYQMLTNHLPHEAPSALEVITQKMAHAPVRPKKWQAGLDDELDGWVMRLLEREPEQRLQTAEEARHALRRIFEGRTPTSTNPANAAVARATGAVPARQWEEAKTAPTDPATGPRPLDSARAAASTDGHQPPWLQGASAPAAGKTTDDSTLPPDAGPPPGRAHVVATVLVNPEEVVRAQAPAQPPVPGQVSAAPALSPLARAPAAGEETEPPSPPPVSRTPLYIVGLLALIAVLAGLILLVR